MFPSNFMRIAPVLLALGSVGVAHAQGVKLQSAEYRNGVIVPVVVPGDRGSNVSINVNSANAGLPIVPNGAQVATSTALTKPPAEVDKWEIRIVDRTVRGALERWVKTAGYRLAWEVPVDYPAVETTFNGTFFEALQSIMEALNASDFQPQAEVYSGNQVVRIVQRGNSRGARQ